MSLYNDISPQVLLVIGITVGVLFALMVLRIGFDVRVLRRGREELNNRIKRLRLNDMIERTGIKHDTYMHKTSDMDKERHIWACEHCPEPEECEHMFEGENIDPHTFCRGIGMCIVCLNQSPVPLLPDFTVL